MTVHRRNGAVIAIAVGATAMTVHLMPGHHRRNHRLKMVRPGRDRAWQSPCHYPARRGSPPGNPRRAAAYAEPAKRGTAPAGRRRWLADRVTVHGAANPPLDTEKVSRSMNTHPDPEHPVRRDGPPTAFPRIVLGLGPTPLHRLTGLMSAFDHGPELLAKREDLCGIAAGGNKIRKLAALLGEALSQRATVVLTTGGVQSNHCAQTAIAAAMYGLRAELYLSGQQPPVPAGNLLIEEVAGAAVTFLGDCSDRDRDDRITARADELRAQGEVPYPIPLGGSTPAGRRRLRGRRIRAGRPARRPARHSPGSRGGLTWHDGRPHPRQLGQRAGLPGARLHRAVAAGRGDDPP